MILPHPASTRLRYSACVAFAPTPTLHRKTNSHHSVDPAMQTDDRRGWQTQSSGSDSVSDQWQWRCGRMNSSSCSARSKVRPLFPSAAAAEVRLCGCGCGRAWAWLLASDKHLCGAGSSLSRCHPHTSPRSCLSQNATPFHSLSPAHLSPSLSRFLARPLSLFSFLLFSFFLEWLDTHTHLEQAFWQSRTGSQLQHLASSVHPSRHSLSHTHTRTRTPLHTHLQVSPTLTSPRPQPTVCPTCVLA